MKTLLLLFTILSSTSVMAAPILNENYAITDYITIYRDSMDANLYYYAPNHMTVCRDEEGAPYISITDVPVDRDRTHLLIMSTLCLGFRGGLQDSLTSIRAANPQARFAGVAFSSSRVILKDKVLSSFIFQSSCDHSAGIIGQEQACSFRLNTQGRQVFKRNVAQGLAMVLQFEYSIQGVARNSAGTFDNANVTFNVAGRITSSDLKKKLNLSNSK